MTVPLNDIQGGPK